jgi:hypothetical protein
MTGTWALYDERAIDRDDGSKLPGWYDLGHRIFLDSSQP